MSRQPVTVDLDRQGSGGTADGGRRTATATKWVGFPSDFFPSSNRLFRFPSYLEIVPIFLLFIEIFVSVVFTFKNGSRVSVFCQGNLCIFHASLIFWFSICWFMGFIFYFPTAIILRVGLGFVVFC